MDTGIIIVGIILIVLSILPFVLAQRNRRKRERKLFQSLSNIATKQNCKITQYECSDDYIIGIDETSNFLLFFKQIKDTEFSQFLNLSEIQSCKTINISRTNGSIKKIDRLELHFLSKTKKNPDTILELYSSDNRMQLGDDLLLVERWEKKINELLKHNNQRINQTV
ncbi:MAG: hypothetical protein HUU48_06470 [Flavobacteriales bacterium]|nr:hypothetical protein [Flavobacteriales bacterium]